VNAGEVEAGDEIATLTQIARSTFVARMMGGMP